MAYMRQKLEEIVTELRKNLVLSKPEESTNFKYTGCRTQFEFNQRKINELELVYKYLKFGRIENAREIPKSIREKLFERNTHVRIADKYGWDTLEEYVGDSLVYGSDELWKAESRAIKKRKEKSDKKPYGRGGSSIRNDLFRINNGGAGRQHFTQAGFFFIALGQQRHRSTCLDSPSLFLLL